MWGRSGRRRDLVLIIISLGPVVSPLFIVVLVLFRLCIICGHLLLSCRRPNKVGSITVEVGGASLQGGRVG